MRTPAWDRLWSSRLARAALASSVLVLALAGPPGLGGAQDHGKVELAMESVDASPRRVAPNEAIVVSGTIRNTTDRHLDVVISPVVSDVPFEIVEEHPEFNYTLAPGESVDYRVAIAIGATGAFKVGIGAVGLEGFVEPVTTIVAVESGSERWWVLLGFGATFLLSIGLVGLATFAGKRTAAGWALAVTGLGVVGSGATLLILANAFYDWVYLGIQGSDAAVALGIVGLTAGLIAAAATGRRLGVLAMIIAPVWLGLFAVLADFDVAGWQLVAAVLAGGGFWAATRAKLFEGRTDLRTGALAASAGLWTVSASTITQAIVLRSVYGTDFFVL